MYNNKFIPVIFCVVVITPFVLELLPRLAMLAGRHQDDVSLVVEMIKGIPCLRAYPVNVPLPFERQEVFLVDGEIVCGHCARLTALLRMVLSNDIKRRKV
jgi:hypothetical protein